MDENQLLNKKKYGDIRVVAEMIGETHSNTDRILRRPGARKHKKAIEALRKIIEAREELLMSLGDDESNC
ncbi:hypothetical protein [Alkaliflexus imshenetskii]|uniref:hypothetical protein n=1 Tax=Alkaliflexus imshenetskii TaxID=286730 RepID=UPI00047E24BB|nr:hypothetical protein [Alkaliflexus imshenetskii]